MNLCQHRTVHPEPELYLHDDPLTVVETYQFLGLVFDARLTWLPHLCRLKRRYWQRLNDLRCLSNTNWGADHSTLLQLYKALVQYRLDYGSLIYGSAAPSALHVLDPVHHCGVRVATGAFRTSPVTSVLVETGVPPLQIRRAQLLASYIAHIHSSPEHPNYHLLFPPKAVHHPHRQPRSGLTIAVRIWSLLSELESFPSPPPIQVHLHTPLWCTPRPQICLDLSLDPKDSVGPATLCYHFLSILDVFRGSEVVYTDDSMADGHVGFAYIHRGHFEQHSLPDGCSVFTAKLVAISHALRYIHSCPRESFLLCTDSLSSLQAIDQCYPCHPLVASIQESIYALDQTPWFSGICVDPRTHRHPRQCTCQHPTRKPFLEMDISEPDLRSDVCHRVFRLWETEWHNSTHNKLRVIKETTNVWKSSMRASLRESVIPCRLRICHAWATHGYLLCCKDPPECRCGAQLAVAHILVHCPTLTAQWRNLGLPDSLPLILFDNASSANLVLCFICEGGFYHLI